MFLVPLLGLLGLGGGGNKTVSQNTLEVLNKTINDVSTDIEKNCSVNQNASQDIVYNIKVTGCDDNVISGNNQTINSKSSLDCTTVNISENDLISILRNNFSQVADSKKSGLFGGFANETSANNSITIDNIVSNRSAIKDITDALNTAIHKQSTTYNVDVTCVPRKNIDLFGRVMYSPTKFRIENVNQSIINDQVAKALLSSTSINKSIIDLDNQVKQDAKAALEGISGFEFIGIIIAIIILCIVVAVVFKVIRSKGSYGSYGAGGYQMLQQDTRKKSLNWMLFAFASFSLVVVGGLMALFYRYIYFIEGGKTAEETYEKTKIKTSTDPSVTNETNTSGMDVTKNSSTYSTDSINKANENISKKQQMSIVDNSLICIGLFAGSIVFFIFSIICHMYSTYNSVYYKSMYFTVICYVATIFLSIACAIIVYIEITRIRNTIKLYETFPEVEEQNQVEEQ